MKLTATILRKSQTGKRSCTDSFPSLEISICVSSAPKILAQEFGTTERNIYRDLKDLDAAGFSITFDKEINSYRFTDPDFSLRDLNLNRDELTALLVGQQISHYLGKPFEKAFQSLLSGKPV